jgi:hypothetical protein
LQRTTFLLNEKHPVFVKNGEHSSLTLWHPLESKDVGLAAKLIGADWVSFLLRFASYT